MRFISDNYNFTDRIIDKIELSSNLKDVVIVIDCFIGKDASSTKKNHIGKCKRFNNAYRAGCKQ